MSQLHTLLRRNPIPVQVRSPVTFKQFLSAVLLRIHYCFSYTAVLLNFLPCESVPLVVTVRLLPSADTTTRPLVVILPPFLTLNSSVCSSIFVYDRMSEFGLPVTGHSSAASRIQQLALRLRLTRLTPYFARSNLSASQPR